MKKLCVIMSLYKNDTLTFAKQAIESVLNQTYGDFDFYMLSDGVIPNDIRSYILDLAKSDDRVKFKEREENKGLAFSLNELLYDTLGKYDYYARMDADDISMPDRFKKEVDFLDSHKDIDCVGCWAIEIDEDNKEFFKKQMPVSNQECLELFKKRDCMIHPTVMFRNTYFEKAGMYPEDTYFGEDTMMWANGFANGCKFHNIPEYLFQFRINKDFFSRRRGWRHATGILKLRHRVNNLLNFGVSADCFALLYFVAKMMPKPILNIIYKTFR